MITTLLFDLCRTLLYPKDRHYQGELNLLHQQLVIQPIYHFFDHFYLDEMLIKTLIFYQETYPIYLFTSGTIQDYPSLNTILKPVFTGIISAETLGFSKHNPKAYVSIAQNIDTIPSQILFVDDSATNIQAARTALLPTIHHHHARSTIAELNHLLTKK